MPRWGRGPLVTRFAETCSPAPQDTVRRWGERRLNRHSVAASDGSGRALGADTRLRRTGWSAVHIDCAGPQSQVAGVACGTPTDGPARRAPQPCASRRGRAARRRRGRPNCHGLPIGRPHVPTGCALRQRLLGCRLLGRGAPPGSGALGPLGAPMDAGPAHRCGHARRRGIARHGWPAQRRTRTPASQPPRRMCDGCAIQMSR